MIEPTRNGGREMALCTCDDCSATVLFPAMHGTGQGGRGKNTVLPPLVNEGKVIQQAQAAGWSMIGKKLRCPACEAARKAPKEKPMTNVEPIRQPSREQKRQIIEMLTATYDTAKERYTGTETDLTIADAIGGGCMFGWVAAIREDMFGPAGGNEEHEQLLADLHQWRENADKLAADMHGNLRDFNDARAKVKAFEDRLAAVVKAVGPKAVRA